MGFSYKFTRSELARSLSEVPAMASLIPPYPGAHTFDRADLHNVNLYLLYSHASGFFARAEASWYLQDNLAQTSGNMANVAPPGDEFWQVNFLLGYRFRKNLGDVSIGVMNATDTDYKLNPLNTYTELPRERVMAARLRLRF